MLELDHLLEVMVVLQVASPQVVDLLTDPIFITLHTILEAHPFPVVGVFLLIIIQVHLASRIVLEVEFLTMVVFLMADLPIEGKDLLMVVTEMVLQDMDYQVADLQLVELRVVMVVMVVPQVVEPQAVAVAEAVVLLVPIILIKIIFVAFLLWPFS